MKPIEFPQDLQSTMHLSLPECKLVTFAKDQPEYLPLPALVMAGSDRRVISRWRMTWRERLRVFLTGDLFLSQLTFWQRLQPVKLSTSLHEAIE